MMETIRFTNTKDVVEYMKKNKNKTIIFDEGSNLDLDRYGKSKFAIKIAKQVKSFLDKSFEKNQAGSIIPIRRNDALGREKDV